MLVGRCVAHRQYIIAGLFLRVIRALDPRIPIWLHVQPARCRALWSIELAE